MIQRIQSIYLLIAGILVMLMYKIPIAIFSSGNVVYSLFACHIKHPETGDLVLNVLPMAVLPLLSMFLSFFALIKFKNRVFQIKLGKLNILILFALLAVESIFVVRLQGILGDGMPQFSAILPIISLLLIIMANRAIKKDENLVRSADRIR
jgi:hypothetical protein